MVTTHPTSPWLSRPNWRTNSLPHSLTLSICLKKTTLRPGLTFIIKSLLIWGSVWRTILLKVDGEAVSGNICVILMSSKPYKYTSKSWKKEHSWWLNYTGNLGMDALDKSSSTGINSLKSKGMPSIKVF